MRAITTTTTRNVRMAPMGVTIDGVSYESIAAMKQARIDEALRVERKARMIIVLAVAKQEASRS